MICPNCNRVYKDDFDFCPYCGTSKPEILTCPKCGFESNEYKFCPKCGVELTKKTETKICSNCGHEYPIDRDYCEKCGNGFSKMQKPKNNNFEPSSKLSEQSKKMLIKYANKFSIDKSKKDEIKKEIEEGKITTKTEVTRIVREIEKEKNEKEKKEEKEKNRKKLEEKRAKEREEEERKISEIESKANYIIYLLNNGKYNDAIHSAHKALEIYDESAFLWYLLGEGYFEIKQYGAALNCFEKAIKFDNNFDGFWAKAADTLTLFGILNAKENNFKKARNFFEEAIIYYTEAMKRSNEEKYIVQYRKVLIYLGRI